MARRKWWESKETRTDLVLESDARAWAKVQTRRAQAQWESDLLLEFLQNTEHLNEEASRWIPDYIAILTLSLQKIRPEEKK